MNHKTFKDELAFLSNMHPCVIPYKGLTFSCTEAAYQAEKCAQEEDKIPFTYMNGYEAKKAGRVIQLGKHWTEAYKLQTMAALIVCKFRPYTELAQQLLGVRGPIVEYNYWHDNFWGHCFCAKCKRVEKQNVFGRILTIHRDNLALLLVRNQEDNQP